MPGKQQFLTDLKNDIVLTANQFDVLSLMVHGFNNNQIAEITNFSVRTVESIRSTLLKKFSVHNPLELVATVLTSKLVKYEPKVYKKLWRQIVTQKK